MDYKELFKKACLVQISTSVWRTSKALNQAVLMDKLGEETEWLRGRKFLIDPTLLGPVNTSAQQARNTIKKMSLPFPITGVYMVPKESLTLIDERLNHFEKRFWSAYDDFEGIYEQSRHDAKEVLKELFDESDYPIEIKSKFKFEWRYMTIELPKKTSILTPALYQREKQKFQDLIDETRKNAVLALKEEFSQVVSHLVNRLNSDNEKPRVISNNLFNKINEFIDDLGTRNLFQDEELTQLTEETREIINGVNPYNLKYSQNMRDKMHDQMESMKNTIDLSIQDMPIRKLHVAPVPEEMFA